MKHDGRKASAKLTIALALTWDGARWPVKLLPPKARAFLAGKAAKLALATTKQLASLFTEDQIKEIRICWVPRLKGGKDALNEPFSLPGGMRLSFRAAKIVRLGEMLGVIYLRR